MQNWELEGELMEQMYISQSRVPVKSVLAHGWWGKSWLSGKKKKEKNYLVTSVPWRMWTVAWKRALTIGKFIRCRVMSRVPPYYEAVISWFNRRCWRTWSFTCMVHLEGLNESFALQWKNSTYHIFNCCLKVYCFLIAEHLCGNTSELNIWSKGIQR